VQTEPRRLRLLAGKLLALTAWTAAASTIATVVTVIVAPMAARTNGISTARWSTDLVGTLAGAWTNTFLALLVWGVMGAVIALLARSSAIAISVGVGYVLVFESIIRLVAEKASSWLPGAVLSAVASGGNADIGYATALGLGVAYVLIGLVAAGAVFTRRDISD
jgi:ABC-2 type transport system permease protein